MFSASKLYVELKLVIAKQKNYDRLIGAKGLAFSRR